MAECRVLAHEAPYKTPPRPATCVFSALSRVAWYGRVSFRPRN